MQSLISQQEHFRIPLGERRRKTDLDRFSLDLSWARPASDCARSRAYPSPPMSGSPPVPPRPTLDSGDRGHGSYVSGGGQSGYRGLRTPQLEHPTEVQRNIVQRPYLPLESEPSMSFPGPYRADHLPISQISYQTLPEMAPQDHHQQPPPPHPQPHQPPHHQHHEFSRPHAVPRSSFPPSERPPPHAVPRSSFPPSERPPPMREHADFSSPKQARKTKGHVASACVPCKRAHLRCDAQRPCSRCLSNGKEDACVDVQHKKRGRPRLRDERESRFEGVTPAYPPADSMRRPVSLFTAGAPSLGPAFGTALQQRPGEYRVLKSHGSMSGPITPRYLEHASSSDANVYGMPMLSNPRALPSQEPPCAFLSMEMQVVKATPSLGETIGIPSVLTRSLQDMVIANDRDKVLRLQRGFEDERREREPNYLPPIYLAKFEEDRVIQTIGFGPDEIGQLRTDRQDLLTFQASDGQQRTFQVRLGLGKRKTTYFILLFLHVPVTPQAYQHPSSSPYSRESHSRDSQYGYQTPQHQSGYQQHPSPGSFVSSSGFGDPRLDISGYRTPGPTSLGSSLPQTPTTMPLFPPQMRSEYPPGPAPPYQIPRSELHSQVNQQHQQDLQLPPIREQQQHLPQPAPPPPPPPPPLLSQSGTSRLDIGGLLEQPDPGRRRA